MYKDGRKVTLQDPPITEAEATDLLMWEIDQKCAGIEKYVTATINDNQYAALVSFAYNLGLGALHGSTLLKLLNANGPSQAVADQFLKWDHAGGVAVSGLTRRRQAEHALFMQPVVQSDEQPSTEDVDSKLQTLEDDIMK
jgi:lysozyme